MIPKNKFSKKDWQKLEVNITGYRGEIHHMAGKHYEYLCLFQFLSSEDHRGKGHSKYMNPDQVPDDIKNKNLEFWKKALGEEDYKYFWDRGIAWI